MKSEHLRRWMGVVVSTVVLLSCGNAADKASIPKPVTPEPQKSPRVPFQWAGWPLVTATVDGVAFRVAVATTPDRWVQGWRGVEDPGDLDGILLVFEPPVNGSYDMKEARRTLDWAFFWPDGIFQGGWNAETCPVESCPTFDPAIVFGDSRPQRWVLVVASGRFPPGLKAGASKIVLR